MKDLFALPSIIEDLTYITDGSIETGTILKENIGGYDLHYIFPAENIAHAESFLEALLAYIRANLPEQVNLVESKLFEIPVGPFKEPMFEIKLEHKPNPDNPNEMPIAHKEILHHFIKAIIIFCNTQFSPDDLTKNALIIHANSARTHSNLLEEKILHQRLWHVCGKRKSLKDIWGCKKGLIDMENYLVAQLKTHLKLDAVAIEKIITNFKSVFRDNPVFTNITKLEGFVRSFIEAQQVLPVEEPKKKLMSTL